MHRISHLVWTVWAVTIVISSVGICGTVHLLKGAIAGIIKVGKFKFGLVYQGIIQGNILQSIILSGCFEPVFCVFKRIVGNEMVLYTVDGHGHCLLEQAILFELIRVHQRANKSTISVLLRTVLLLGRRTR